MSAASHVGDAPLGTPRGYLQVGRTFLHPALDYLLIGGGLSLIVAPLLPRGGNLYPGESSTLMLATFVLLFNSAHFAASSVRLYTKPGAFREHPFVTMALPLLAIAVVTTAIAWSADVGHHLFMLYLTWSPYHYAAQAFGLAAMYCYRSGCQLDASDRRLLWGSCMLPFAYAFLSSESAGLAWFVPQSFLMTHPSLLVLRTQAANALAVLTFAFPVLLVVRVGRRGQALPLISLLLMVTNGIWWIAFWYLDAFLWATVFHGIQYLVIVSIFHARDQVKRPGNRYGALGHTLRFYAVCLVLGYLLFDAWPYAFVLMGFQLSESMLLVSAIVNIHHFIVDRFIWRLRKDPNYKIVVGEASGAAAQSPSR